MAAHDEAESQRGTARCALYDDPVDGMPKAYARYDLPKITHYSDGQMLPTPKDVDFQPCELLGSVSGELGLRKYLEANGHELVVTSSKDGPDSELEKHLHDAEVVISQPFWAASRPNASPRRASSSSRSAGIGSAC